MGRLRHRHRRDAQFRFFLLPGLAAAGAGPAMPLSYLLAALILLPGLLSKLELATAMPRAGGIY